MENFLKNLKSKLTIENVVELVEDGKVIDEDMLNENKINESDIIRIKSEMDGIKKLNEPDEKKNQNDSKDSDSSSSKVENSNEAQKEQSKPVNRELTFFF